MKILFFTIFCWLLISETHAQEVATSLVEKTPFTKERFVGVDKFNNQYSINKNIFFKLDKQTNKNYQFSDIQLGKIFSVDIINPLKITLFYRDMNTVVILDNRLNEIRRINFNTISEFRNVGFATTANDRSLWIFNLDLQQLELFDYNRNVVLSHTQPISNQILGQRSNFNFCWLLNEKKLQFYNSYGSLLSEFKNDDIQAFTEDNDSVIILKNNKLSILPKNSTEFKPLSISENAVKDFYLNNENLYLYSGEFIYHYQLTLPK